MCVGAPAALGQPYSIACSRSLARSPRSQMTSKNIEIGIIDKATGLFRVLTPDQVADYLEEAD